MTRRYPFVEVFPMSSLAFIIFALIFISGAAIGCELLIAFLEERRGR